MVAVPAQDGVVVGGVGVVHVGPAALELAGGRGRHALLHDQVDLLHVVVRLERGVQGAGGVLPGLADHQAAAFALEVDALVDDGERDGRPARVLVREIGHEQHPLLGGDGHAVLGRAAGTVQQLVGPWPRAQGDHPGFHLLSHPGGEEGHPGGPAGSVEGQGLHLGVQLQHRPGGEIGQGPLKVAHRRLAGVEAAAVAAEHPAGDGFQAQQLPHLGIHRVHAAAQPGDHGLHLLGAEQIEIHPVGLPDLRRQGHLGPGGRVVGEQVAGLLETDGHAHVLLEPAQEVHAAGAELLVDGGGPQVAEAAGGEGRRSRSHRFAPVHHQDRTGESLLQEIVDQGSPPDACPDDDQIELAHTCLPGPPVSPVPSVIPRIPHDAGQVNRCQTPFLGLSWELPTPEGRCI